MNRTRTVLAASIFCAAICLAPAPASASSIGLDITTFGSPVLRNLGGYSIGWVFDVSSTVTVIGLGVGDFVSAPGLVEAHAVGLWRANGTLLASTVVPAGLLADVAVGSAAGGQWLFSNITSLTLAPGQYVIGSYSGTGADWFLEGVGAIAMHPSLSFGFGRFLGSGSLQFPTTPAGTDYRYFGPNLLLQGESAAVPEPSTLALVGIALCALGARRVARRSQGRS